MPTGTKAISPMTGSSASMRDDRPGRDVRQIGLRVRGLDRILASESASE